MQSFLDGMHWNVNKYPETCIHVGRQHEGFHVGEHYLAKPHQEDDSPMSTQARRTSVNEMQSTLDTRLTVSAPTPHTEAWINCKELAEANAQVQSLMVPASSDPTHLKKIAQKWLQRELGFIGNPQFSVPRTGREIFAEELGLTPKCSEAGTAEVRNGGVNLPLAAARLCEAPLLTQKQEELLFKRMNFLLYHASINRASLSVVPPSTELIELIERLVALSEWHRDRILEANLRLVFSIVKKYVSANNTFDDLLSDGIVGLIRAVEKFDYGYGFRFSTFATQVVRRTTCRMVMVNQQDRQKVSSGLQDLDLEISDEGRSSAISEKRWHELRSILAVMLDGLDRRERFIVRARFSMGSHRKVHTLQSLANRLGISKERVRQLEHRAIDKLRAMAGETQLLELESAQL
ncbi:sigma-70 family RNA polymerase sigma factor [bacterium]|nr:sigma-70 family RNA polymerase sigma factor [bacterium]